MLKVETFNASEAFNLISQRIEEGKVCIGCWEWIGSPRIPRKRWCYRCKVSIVLDRYKWFRD